MDCLAELDLLEPLVDAEMMAPKKATAAKTNRDTKLPTWIQAIVVVAVASAGFAFWCGQISSDIGHLQKEVTRIDSRLDDIWSSVLTLRAAQAPRKVLQELGALQPKQLSSALPALQKITEQPVAEVDPQPATLQEVAGKLRLVDETAPDYWPTVLRFIQFASAGMSPDAPPAGIPNLIVTNSVIRPWKGAFGNMTGKVIVLDGDQIEDGTFEKCRIVFTGTPTTMRRITFINCIFEFPRQNQPTRYLMGIGRALLASGIQRAFISSAS